MGTSKTLTRVFTSVCLKAADTVLVLASRPPALWGSTFLNVRKGAKSLVETIPWERNASANGSAEVSVRWDFFEQHNDVDANVDDTGYDTGYDVSSQVLSPLWTLLVFVQ